MTITSTANIPTASASRYLQQLAKHWSHKMQVEYDAKHAQIVMPQGARISLLATVDNLQATVVVSAQPALAGVQHALERHIERFAFREAPLSFDWSAPHQTHD